MTDKILVVAAHPDDEVLGCGGTMAKLAAQGKRVEVVILAEGITSRKNTPDRRRDQNELETLKKASQKANEVLGVANLTHHDFPDNCMDGRILLDVVKCIESHIENLRPQIIFTHHCGDVNIDHQIAHKAVVTACRPQPGSPIKSILFFEVPSSTEWQTPNSLPPFLPNWFEDIGENGKDGHSFLSLKIKALMLYEMEMRQWPHSRSLEAVEHLAKWRGASIGNLAAEAFILGRHIS